MGFMGKATNIAYDFEEQRLIEEKFTPLILDFLRALTGEEPLDVRSQCLEYDFKVGNTTYDLKADTVIGKSNNFFIETESVKGKKKGWLYNSTDWILYLDTQYLILYVIELRELQKNEAVIKQWPYQEINQKNNYLTCGYLVPIQFLKRKMSIRQILLRYCLKV